MTMLAVPLGAEPTPLSQDTFLHAKQATVGILEDTQDQRTPEKPGKIAIRGTGFHLRDGYVITARHAAEKHDPAMGTIIQKHVRILTTDLNELPADLVGENAFMDVVIYRIAEPHRSKLQAGTSFATGDVAPGMEVFTVGYPLGWGPTMAFGRLGNTNTFLQTVETRLLQADLSACSGNSGGGLFNAQGEIVGIMHAVIQTEKEETQAHCSRMTFAIPGTLAERIVNAALAGKPLTFSKMGIHMTSVKDGTKWRMAVRDVADPAKAAGIQKHDILDRTHDSRPKGLTQSAPSRCRPDVSCCVGRRMKKVSAACCARVALDTTHWLEPMPPGSRTTHSGWRR
jgi:S1-C subfamily serine protease